MKYRFFHVAARDPAVAAAELNSFCARHRIASVDKALVIKGSSSYWAFCVSYFDGAEPATVGRKARVDYREVLSETDFAVYARLRKLRKELAEAEGVPAYALFTNEHLAEMVTKRVTTAAALQSIDGVGTSKIGKYGKQFLSLRATATADSQVDDFHAPETG